MTPTDYGVPKHHHDITAAELYAILGKRDPKIFEVGAADGQTTQQFLDVMPDAEIACFECDPRCLEALHRKFRGHPQVRIFDVTISDRNGEATFYQSGGLIPHSTEPCREDWYLSGSLHKPTGHLERDQWVKFPTQVKVRTAMLDMFSYLPEHGDIDLMFVDLQGAEARLILGGQHMLRKTSWLYIEFYDIPQYDRQPDLKGILSFLPDFDLVAIYADNALLKNRLVD